MAKFTVYFTSDTHGYLYNTNFVDTMERPMGVLSMRFPKDGNTLVIDGGDTLQGSPLTYFLHETREKGFQRMLPEAFNERGYDYVTLGNHDFNYGKAYLADYLKALSATCLCANVTDEDGMLPTVPYTVRTLENGTRLGLFGITTHWIRLWEKQENIRGVHITDPVEAARQAVEALRAEHVDKVIGVYHGGFEKDLQTEEVLSGTDENLACRICEELPVDLLLTGHQHIAIEGQMYHSTYVVQTPSNATKYVRVEMDEEGLFSSSFLVPDQKQTWTAYETEVRRHLDAWLDRPIGHLSDDIWPVERLDMALHGTKIADFFNRVQLWASQADVSLTMLPNECRGFARDVTVRDVVATYVYPNTLCVLRATGKDIREALERTATYFHVEPDGSVQISERFLRPKEEHYNYDYFAGVDYAFDLLRPEGERVIRLERDGKPLLDDEELTVCMCNYRATGAGEYPMWAKCVHARDILTEVSELILAYLSEHDRVDLPEPSCPVCFLGDRRL